MPRRRTTAGAALVAAGALAASALGPALATGDGSDLTIQVRSVTVQDAELDLGEPGVGIGDQYVFSSDLFRVDNGRPAGQDGGACTIVRIDAATEAVTGHCVGTVSFPRGQVTVQGLVTFAEDEAFDIAVTGGTGRYVGVGGTLTVRPVSETEERLTLRLRFPKR